MKHLHLGMLATALSTLLLAGCGSSGTSSTYETQPATPEVPVTDGNVIIVSPSDGSTAGLSYTEVGDGSIIIDCGAGGCGGVVVGSEVTETNGTN